jgi:DNA-binding transcriptional ArsR family regulator
MRELFKVLGEPHRYAMVRMLLEGPRHVQAMADEMDVPQPAVSRHARILADAGLISMEREGRFTVLRCPPQALTPGVRGVLALFATRPLPPARTPDGASRGEGSGGTVRGPSLDRPSPGRTPAPRSDELEDFLL